MGREVAKRRKRVFILGGGAALGAHHVGALKYLEELGIRPDAIIGSSIGVLNACGYATGGVPLLEKVWTSFSSLPRIFSPSLRHNLIFGLSLFSMDRLTSATEEHFDFAKIFDSPIEMEFVLLNVSRGRAEMHSKADCADWEELRTISRAGYAIPLLFPPVRFRGDWYVDGGFAWNIPLDRALDLGATEIYLLAPIPSELPYQRSFPTSLAFMQRFVDVMWRTIGNMGYIYAPMTEGRFHGVPVLVVEPGEQWSGFGPMAIFNAYPKKNKSLMSAGYRDAKRAVAIRRRQEEARRAPKRPSAAPRLREDELAPPRKVVAIRPSEPDEPS
jgi:NTE family protein